MAPELIGLLVGVIVVLSFLVAWLLLSARTRFLASLNDGGDQGADWGSEGFHNGTGQ